MASPSPSGGRLASPYSRPWRAAPPGTVRPWGVPSWTGPAGAVLLRAARLLAILAAGLTLSAAPLFSGPALAHQVNVFAVAESGVLRGEGYFGGGAKARDCPVEVLDATGAVVASGRTGQDGSFALTLPAKLDPPLTVALRAGDGHRGDYTLTAADLGAAASASTAQTPFAPVPTSAHSEPVHAAGTRPAPQALSGVSAPTPDEARLAELVEAAAARAVEEKLSPLRLELAKLAAREDSARFRDVIGGLGWIAGLLGLAAWLKRPKG